MPFPKAPSQNPTTIGAFVITANSTLAADGTRHTAFSYRAQVLDADGKEVNVLTGDLDPQLTADQRTTLDAVLTTLITKAQTEAIPL